MNNPFSLQNKTIFVTGASSGIGKAVAVECSKMGANLLITGRNRVRLQETFESLVGECNQMFVADLEESEELLSLIADLPNIDGIVHCAGISGHKPFAFLKKEDFTEMFNINFFVPVQLSMDLLKAKKINKNASIVFITSISGILSSYFGGSVYSATKGAISGVLKGMALDLSSKKIRVNGVMPAMVQTEIMNSGSITKDQWEVDIKKYPLGRYGMPEEVAYAVIYLLSDASLWTTGTNILLDGGRTIAY